MNLSVKNLCAGYGKRSVLKDISFSIPEGKICALMGPNGSGKTTLLRCINGVIPLKNGTIEIMGQNISTLNRLKIARLISVVPQVSFSPFSFSCMDMVLMSGASRMKAWGTPGVEEKEKALKILEECGIRHLADRAFNNLSGGERQLVMLGRGLFQDAPVMLLDEPNTHLDFANQHHIMGLIRAMVEKHSLTVLITLHDPNLTHYYCDEVIMIKEGKVAAQGPTRTTMTDQALRRVLGDNIQTDITQKGVFVVTPKYVHAGVSKPHEVEL